MSDQLNDGAAKETQDLGLEAAPHNEEAAMPSTFSNESQDESQAEDESFTPSSSEGTGEAAHEPESLVERMRHAASHVVEDVVGGVLGAVERVLHRDDEEEPAKGAAPQAAASDADAAGEDDSQTAAPEPVATSQEEEATASAPAESEPPAAGEDDSQTAAPEPVATSQEEEATASAPAESEPPAAETHEEQAAPVLTADAIREAAREEAGVYEALTGEAAAITTPKSEGEADAEIAAAGMEAVSEGRSPATVEVTEEGEAEGLGQLFAPVSRSGSAPSEPLGAAESAFTSTTPYLGDAMESPTADGDAGDRPPAEPIISGTDEASSEDGGADAAAEGGGEQKRRRRKRGGSGGGKKGRSLDSFQPGEELQGTVRSIQPYGAFVDVGAERDGLIHISELRDGFVEKVEDVAKEGDAVTVRIKDIDTERGRLSLTMRSEQAVASSTGGRGEEASSDKDKRTRLRDLQEGQELTGTVTSIVEFGAFVDVGAATDGLVHISEMSEERIRRVSDVVAEGQEVTVRVLGVDRKRNRISLSMRPAQETDSYSFEDEDGSEEPPSAMEAAFARARERNRKEERRAEKRQESEQPDPQEDIIERTLRQREG